MSHIAHCCNTMREITSHGNLGISYVDIFKEYLIMGVGPAPQTSVLITYCPFCGAQLSRSCRRQWMANYERLAPDDCRVHDVFNLPDCVPDALRKPCGNELES